MKKLKTAVCAALVVSATQVSAHGVESTSAIISIASGASETVNVSCHNQHRVTGGGYQLAPQLSPDGPIVVTASYPSAIGTWSVDVANRSGRATNNHESKITVYAVCSGGHH